MKHVYLLTSLLLIQFFAQAQIIAHTNDGRRVVLLPNGTWRYASSPGNGGSNGFPNSASQDVHALYQEAYNYAYDIVYADEFFSTERKQKAIIWSTDYLRSNLKIFINQNKSLDQWYDELYSFANDKLYSNEWFSQERKNKSATWVAQTLLEKAWWDDYQTPLLQKHRQAYDVAFNKIYKNEFFAADRRKKAMQWANDFTKR